MTCAGIAITDADSLMAAADSMDDAEGAVIVLDFGRDDEPEPSTPAAPALALVVPLFRCMTCRDTGRVVKPSGWFPGKTAEGFCPACVPHFDFARRGFVNCVAGPAPAAEVPAPEPAPAPAPRRFDRAAHCQRIGQAGGMKTLERHGRAHYVAIGKAGYAATVKAHGVAYVNGLLTAKGWTGQRRPDLLADLAAGRILADLDRAA